MTRYSDPHLRSVCCLNLFRNLVGYRRIFLCFELLFIILLAQLCVCLRNRTLRDCNDCKALSGLRPTVDRFDNLLDVIRYLRDQNDIRAACDS